MLKLALKDEDLFKRYAKHPILGRFAVFRIDCFQNLRDPLLASRLIQNIWTSDGTSKQTAPGRFRDLDSLVVNCLTEELNSIHDVAVSSGITSVELYSYMRKAFHSN